MLSLATGCTWRDGAATASPLSGSQIWQLSTTDEANSQSNLWLLFPYTLKKTEFKQKVLCYAHSKKDCKRNFKG